VGNILRRYGIGAGTQAEPEDHLEGFHCFPHGRTGRYRLLLSSSQWRCLPGEVWPLTTSCSSSIWKPAASASRA
jgi:hypothetical protein